MEKEQLYHYCPRCKDQVQVELKVHAVTVITPLLIDRDAEVRGSVRTDVTDTEWVSDDCTDYECRCPWCGHVFCQIRPDTVEEFEEYCKEYEETK